MGSVPDKEFKVMFIKILDLKKNVDEQRILTKKMLKRVPAWHSRLSVWQHGSGSGGDLQVVRSSPIRGSILSTESA